MFLSFVPLAVTYQNSVENPAVPSFMFTVMEIAIGGQPACLFHISVHPEGIYWDVCFLSLLINGWNANKDKEDVDDIED
jgi:hypothetical protein